MHAVTPSLCLMDGESGVLRSPLRRVEEAASLDAVVIIRLGCFGPWDKLGSCHKATARSPLYQAYHVSWDI